MSPGAKKTYAVNAPLLFLFTHIINKQPILQFGSMLYSDKLQKNTTVFGDEDGIYSLIDLRRVFTDLNGNKEIYYGKTDRFYAATNCQSGRTNGTPASSNGSTDESTSKKTAQMTSLFKALTSKPETPSASNQVPTPNFAVFDPSTELWEDYWSRFSTFASAHSVPEGKKA